MGLTLLKLFILCNFKFHNNLAEYSPQLLFIKVENNTSSLSSHFYLITCRIDNLIMNIVNLSKLDFIM